MNEKKTLSEETIALIRPYREKYRVFFLGVGMNADEEKELFCRRVSEEFDIPHSLLRKIIDHCPVVLKKDLSRKMAESLARTLKSFGARVAVEVKRDVPPCSVDFQSLEPRRLALEFSSFGRTRGGVWNVVGRARNITSEPLDDVWVLIQIFGDHEEFLTFDEVPLTLNPLPPGEISPFKAVFERDLLAYKVSIGFKTSSGKPLGATDGRPVPQWERIEGDEGDQPALSIDLSTARHPVQVEKHVDESKIDAIAYSSEDLQLSEEEDSRKTENPSEAVILDSNDCGKLSSHEERPSSGPIEPPPGDPSGRVEEGCSNAIDLLPPVPVHKEKEVATAIPEREITEVPEGDAGSEGSMTSNELPRLDVSTFEEAGRLVNEISERTEIYRSEPSSFPWLEDFRKEIDHFYQEHSDPFVQWFKARQSAREFSDDLHSLLVLLAHARFDQMNDTTKALKNTESVFPLLAKPRIAVEEVPDLEGTLFFSEGQWRELFYRAMPKLQQIGRSILDKRSGQASEIERMILVIPHLSERMGRKAVRWISELMPQAMTIDFSNQCVFIDRPLYRVACRLGIVDPRFDSYQGRNSMGDLKIQGFAKSVFVGNPSKIEAPMTWIGREETGGYCLPTGPVCEGCPFEKFCQKLYLRFDPSEKGMRRY